MGWGDGGFVCVMFDGGDDVFVNDLCEDGDDGDVLCDVFCCVCEVREGVVSVTFTRVWDEYVLRGNDFL